MCRIPPHPAERLFSGLVQNFWPRAAVARHVVPPPKQTPWRRPWVVMVYRCVNNLVDIPLTYYQAAPVATLKRTHPKVCHSFLQEPSLSSDLSSRIPLAYGICCPRRQLAVQLSISFDEMCSTYNSATNGRSCFLLTPAMHISLVIFWMHHTRYTDQPNSTKYTRRWTVLYKKKKNPRCRSENATRYYNLIKLPPLITLHDMYIHFCIS